MTQTTCSNNNGTPRERIRGAESLVDEKCEESLDRGSYLGGSRCRANAFDLSLLMCSSVLTENSMPWDLLVSTTPLEALRRLRALDIETGV
jgi:hypothetical protein